MADNKQKAHEQRSSEIKESKRDRLKSQETKQQSDTQKRAGMELSARDRHIIDARDCRWCNRKLHTIGEADTHVRGKDHIANLRHNNEHEVFGDTAMSLTEEETKEGGTDTKFMKGDTTKPQPELSEKDKERAFQIRIAEIELERDAQYLQAINNVIARNGTKSPRARLREQR